MKTMSNSRCFQAYSAFMTLRNKMLKLGYNKSDVNVIFLGNKNYLHNVHGKEMVEKAAARYTKRGIEND